MERQIRYRVTGLRDAEEAQRVEAILYAKVGVHEVSADAKHGVVWLRYDSRSVPIPRLRSYLADAGVRPLEVLDGGES